MSTITLCSELRVTRADLKALPTPARLGPRHFPVKHIDLVTNLDEVLKANDLEIVEEKLGLNGEDGERLFAATIVRPQPNSPLSSYARDGQDFALGKNREGDADMLGKLGQEMGFTVTVVPLLSLGTSSTVVILKV